MDESVDSLLHQYESGRLSRRALVGLLGALAASAGPVPAQPAPLRARSLNHASLIVSDLERSVAFYQSVFGLTVKSRQTGGVNLAVGDAFLGVYQGGADATPHINHVCFGLESFEPARVASALEGAGLEAESRERDGVAQLYCRDPDGLRIQLQDTSFCGGVGPLGNVCR